MYKNIIRVNTYISCLQLFSAIYIGIIKVLHFQVSGSHHHLTIFLLAVLQVKCQRLITFLKMLHAGTKSNWALNSHSLAFSSQSQSFFFKSVSIVTNDTISPRWNHFENDCQSFRISSSKSISWSTQTHSRVITPWMGNLQG